MALVSVSHSRLSTTSAAAPSFIGLPAGFTPFEPCEGAAASVRPKRGGPNDDGAGFRCGMRPREGAYLDSTRPTGSEPVVSASHAVCHVGAPG